MAGPDNSVEKPATSSKPVQKGKLASFCEFLYDRKAGTILGRTGKSWLEITIFYIIFYSCLAAFFAINLAIFLQTLDPKWPRYYGKGSIIGINPGLGYQPWIKTNAESTLIGFDKNDNNTYAKYTDALNQFWKRYNSSGEHLRNCTDKQSNRDNTTDACVFPLQDFSSKGCGPPHFGYDEGKPCVILTLNKLIAWEPVRYPKDSIPTALPPQVQKDYNGDVAVACEGEFTADKENIGQLQYIPTSGISKKFFPYKFMDSYQQPFAMVKFNSLKPGVLVEVECKAYAYNIIHDRANRLGMVHFEVYLQPPKPAS